MDDALIVNRDLWDRLVAIHAVSDFYDVAGFRSGRNTLLPVELQEVGEVSGLSLLHLQCHFGLDTLSWARLGARVTGVDFSPEAIREARRLSDECRLAAEFICADVNRLPDALEGRFDVVYTSYGVLAWLPDLPAWGRAIHRCLVPGGRFYMVEIHPFSQVFEDEEDGSGLRRRYAYFSGGAPLLTEWVGSYADANAPFRHAEYEWGHTLSDVVNAVCSAGMALEYLHEHPFTVYPQFRALLRGDDRCYRLCDGPGLPLLFSLQARRPVTG